MNARSHCRKVHEHPAVGDDQPAVLVHGPGRHWRMIPSAASRRCCSQRGRHHYTFLKKSIAILVGSLIILFVVGIASLWLRRGPGTMRVELTGVAGSPFTGYYVREGRRVAVAGVLPWSFQNVGVSEFEFRKLHPEDSLTFTAHYDEPGGMHGVHVIVVPSGEIGLRDKFYEHGMHTERL